MRTKKVLSILAASMALTVACDKIEPDESGNHIVFAGAAGTWYDSEQELPAENRAMVEKYTGVRCVNCPTADNVISAAAEKYGHSLIAVGVHSGRFGEPLNGEQDLRTEKGTLWFEYFGVTGQPAAMVNRGRTASGWDLFTPTSGFDDRIDAIVGQSATVAIAVESQHTSGRNYTAQVNLDYKQDLSDRLTVTLLVIEDDIHTTQKGQGTEYSDYVQNHVLREVVTDAWGMEVEADGQAGTRRMVRVAFELREDCKPEKCHLVAFVSKKETREIVNVAECDLQ